jgi:fengycin family lipopeptide synthetase B
MMNTVEFLAHIHSLGVRVWIEHDHLRCSVPKSVATAELRTELLERKTSILDFLNSVTSAAGAAALPIRPAPRDSAPPLSFAQQRLWFLNQLIPNNTAYNIFTAVRLRGPLHVRTLERCFNEVIRRHEALRTSLAIVDSQPAQLIAAALALAIPLVNLCRVVAAEQDALVHHLASQEAQTPFDLARSPLVRATLLLLGERDHVLLLTMHHAISDGWSMGILIRELAVLYEAFSSGKPSPLPELSIQYADYAVWQREWLQGDVLKEQVAYWKQHLAGAPTVLDLPANRPRPPMQTLTGATEVFSLPEDLTAALRALSLAEEATLFNILLAAFNILLCRYTGQEHILLGSPIANRNRAEIEGLIGFFVNTVVLHTDLSGNPTFRELLGRVREATLGAYAHPDLPFEILVDQLQRERDLSRSPLFQVMFVLNVPIEILATSDLALNVLETENGRAQFDLTLFVSEMEQELLGSLEYNTALFDAATIARLAGHYRLLLEDIAAHPARRISDLSLLTEAERRQLEETWNATEVGSRLEHCFRDLFAAQVARTPDAIAAVCDDTRLTYSCLCQQASRLAARLIAQGIGPEVLVAVLSRRDLDFLTAVLAIFATGGAYLPLDPRLPAQRLRQVLQQSQSRQVLCAGDMLEVLSDVLEGLPDHVRPQVLVLAPAYQLEPPATSLAAYSAPRNLAYVIYTSGSTGVPKGAMLEQRGMINHLYAKIRDLQLTGADILAQTASQSFDISVWQFLAALLVGGQVQIYPDEIAFDPKRLLERLARDQVTIVETVPSLLGLMLEVVERAVPAERGLAALRWLMPTGEVLPPGLARRWLCAFPHAPIINAYGPTECSDDVAHYPFAELAATVEARIPIGRPVANTRLYILDTQLRLVPVGVAGELYVGGVGVGRGYLHGPDKTAQAFIPDPFCREDGGWKIEDGSADAAEKRSSIRHPPSSTRLYRTGDLARWRADGTIDFLGRIDQQVKLRGFRIELGEIENVLSQHPAVREAIISPQVMDPNAGTQRLIAYVVVHQATALSVGELRQFLQQHLPNYMIPSGFVFLDALPLTPSGKIDRRNLTNREGVQIERDNIYMAPRTSQEAILAQVWAQVLGVARVGIHDNFFEIGGDSLLALQLVTRARQAGVEITPRQLFTHQTIAELVAELDMPSPAYAEQGLITGPLPLTDAQTWLLSCGRAEVERPFWNDVLLFDVPPGLNTTMLAEVTVQLVLHHDALRARFVETDAGWHAFIAAPDDHMPFVAIDLSAVPDSELGAAIEREGTAIQSTIDLTEGPLMLVMYMDCGPARAGRLLVVIHHIVTDGVSTRVLLDDLLRGYQQLQTGAALQLPPKTTPFSTWTTHLHAYAQSPELLAAFEAWSLLPWNMIPPLPRDYPAPREAATMDSICEVSMALSHEETQRLLRTLPTQYQAQMVDALLAALLSALMAWSPERWFGVMLMEGGREPLPGAESQDLSRTVGWFAHALHMILERPADSGPDKVLAATIRQRQGYHGLRDGLYYYLRHDTTIKERLEGLQPYEIFFSYGGQMLTMETAIEVRPSVEQCCITGTVERAAYVIECLPLINNGQISVRWIYSERLHRRTTIERLGQDFLATLQALAKQDAYTPAPVRNSQSATAE